MAGQAEGTAVDLELLTQRIKAELPEHSSITPISLWALGWRVKLQYWQCDGSSRQNKTSIYYMPGTDLAIANCPRVVERLKQMTPDARSNLLGAPMAAAPEEEQDEHGAGDSADGALNSTDYAYSDSGTERDEDFDPQKAHDERRRSGRPKQTDHVPLPPVDVERKLGDLAKSMAQPQPQGGFDMQGLSAYVLQQHGFMVTRKVSARGMVSTQGRAWAYFSCPLLPNQCFGSRSGIITALASMPNSKQALQSLAAAAAAAATSGGAAGAADASPFCRAATPLAPAGAGAGGGLKRKAPEDGFGTIPAATRRNTGKPGMHNEPNNHDVPVGSPDGVDGRPGSSSQHANKAASIRLVQQAATGRKPSGDPGAVAAANSTDGTQSAAAGVQDTLKLLQDTSQQVHEAYEGSQQLMSQLTSLSSTLTVRMTAQDSLKSDPTGQAALQLLIESCIAEIRSLLVGKAGLIQQMRSLQGYALLQQEQQALQAALEEAQQKWQGERQERQRVQEELQALQAQCEQAQQHWAQQQQPPAPAASPAAELELLQQQLHAAQQGRDEYRRQLAEALNQQSSCESDLARQAQEVMRLRALAEAADEGARLHVQQRPELMEAELQQLRHQQQQQQKEGQQLQQLHQQQKEEEQQGEEQQGVERHGPCDDAGLQSHLAVAQDVVRGLQEEQKQLQLALSSTPAHTERVNQT